MLDHVAIVTGQLETMKNFYVKYFGGRAKKWVSPDGEGVLYFILYENGTCLELEQQLKAKALPFAPKASQTRIEHISFRVKDREEVCRLTKEIEEDGYTIIQQPTDYGCEGFFESCLLDPDGNLVEICIDACIFC